MEAKAKGASKSASKAEKKEAPPPPKPDPVPAEPAPPAAPETEKPADGATDQQGATGESGGCGCEMLESLKPFLIGGAVVALGAVLVGVILLAKKN